MSHRYEEGRPGRQGPANHSNTRRDKGSAAAADSTPTRRRLTQSARTVQLPNGRRLVIVDTDIPDDAPEPVREGLARRRLVNGGGTCPCGARYAYPNRAQRRAGVVPVATIEHEPGCPAATDVLGPLVDAWIKGATT